MCQCRQSAVHGIRQVGMASGLVAQQPTSDRDDPNPLSGSLDLGKNGITQVNGYEQFKARLEPADDDAGISGLSACWPRQCCCLPFKRAVLSAHLVPCLCAAATQHGLRDASLLRAQCCHNLTVP